MRQLVYDHKIISLVILILAVIICVGIFEFVYVLRNGVNVPAPSIPREVKTGEGAPLSYLVMGDSSAIAQGAEYQDGYAVATMQHLAEDSEVSLVNVAVSGARTKDVLEKQLTSIKELKPDVVLLAVGGNDVTHLTSSKSVRRSLDGIMTQLVKQNCNVKIVITGAPQMGSVARFPRPLRALAGLRTAQLNKTYAQFATDKKVTFAKIAEETGPVFAKNPSLFAQDKFHPNAQGYAVWAPVLNGAIDEALSRQPSHCPTD